MTKREQIDAKHKELFGRKGRKDYSDEQLLEKIHEKEPWIPLSEETEEPKEEIKETPKAKEAPKEQPKEAQKAKKIEPANHGEASDSVGNV